jgi:hypothetical protein
METNNLRGVPYPPFSPDLAPSNFFCLACELQGIKFMERDDLLAEIRKILNGISSKVLKEVFIEWKKRMRTCFDAEGEYMD